jgi:hypothetical protein
MTIQELLENKKFESIAALYNWGKNYDQENNPFTFFIDLIGYSEENYGVKLCAKAVLEYVELDYIADALKEFVVRPDEAEDFIRALLDSEIVEGDN